MLALMNKTLVTNLKVAGALAAGLFVAMEIFSRTGLPGWLEGAVVFIVAGAVASIIAVAIGGSAVKAFASSVVVHFVVWQAFDNYPISSNDSFGVMSIFGHMAGMLAGVIVGVIVGKVWRR